MRLPLLGFAVAKETHAPNAIGIFENGVMRDWPALESIYTMSDPPNIARALGAGIERCDVFIAKRARRSRFIGGAEIDRFGNLNTHWVEDNGKRTAAAGQWRSRRHSPRWRGAASLS
jgi:glutaconate CoA-transferase subunit B